MKPVPTPVVLLGEDSMEPAEDRLKRFGVEMSAVLVVAVAGRRSHLNPGANVFLEDVVGVHWISKGDVVLPGSGQFERAAVESGVDLQVPPSYQDQCGDLHPWQDAGGILGPQFAGQRKVRRRLETGEHQLHTVRKARVKVHRLSGLIACDRRLYLRHEFGAARHLRRLSCELGQDDLADGPSRRRGENDTGERHVLLADGVVENVERALAVAESGDTCDVDAVVPGKDGDGSDKLVRCERMLNFPNRVRALSAASGPEARLS